MIAVAAVALVSQGLAADIQQVFDSPDLKGATISAYAVTLEGREIFSLSPDRPLIPASTMKLLTSVYAVETLGLDYRPRTTAWRYRGAVYLQGGGDPGLTVEDLTQLAELLNVRPDEPAFFDDSLFGQGRIGPGWEADDLHRGYAAPVSPLTVNGGKVTLMASAGKAWLEPRNFGIRVSGTIGTGPPDVRFIRDPGSWTLRVWGRAPKEEVINVGTVSLPDPGLCAARVFHPKAVRSGGLSVPRTLIPADAPGIVYPVGTVGEELVYLAPRTVADLLPHVLQNSDNTYAETLLRLASWRETGDGDWPAASRALGAFAERIGIPSNGVTAADGSGLSRRNRLSARALAALLRFATKRPYWETLREALARPGVGTLEKRLAGVEVYAKTGTMSGVSALAGIVRAADGSEILFAVVLNGLASTAAGRRAQDAFVTRLSQGVSYVERRREVSGL
ncbi:MAG: D-alanyl-D-alanine carboxypeptidase/D-alanyl-D-alanine-endopeptidase [Armatimonadetes bacterium]|nr:MAG: D-alanyl-D-alanine carboxypeptidase/D-alanyl-D-alanine-endopeptidase [Armatimonadota bacterium]